MLLPVLAVLICVASMLDAKPLAKKVVNSTNPFGPLTFSSDGTFQISIFEDLHFGESNTSHSDIPDEN